jgi:hypothetical protein
MLSVCIKTSDNVTIVWVLNGWYRFGLGFYDLWIIIFSNCPDNMVFFVFQFIIQMSLNASILLISKGLNYFYESKNKSWATYYILSKKKRDGRNRVYRHQNERFARNCVLEVDNFGGGSVMMWGAKTQLVHIHGNLNAAR